MHLTREAKRYQPSIGLFEDVQEAIIAGVAGKMVSAQSRINWRRDRHPKACARFEHCGDLAEVHLELCR